MTPLVRWVLLVALLGRSASVPAQRGRSLDACVPLCLAESVAEGSRESCDYGRLVQQLDQRLQGPRGLLRLCLAPCALGSQGRNFVFESSALCRKLRMSILEQQRCACHVLENRKDLDFLDNDPRWIEELVDKYSGVLRGNGYPVDRVTMKILASHGVRLEDLEDRYDGDEKASDSPDAKERQDLQEGAEADVNKTLNAEGVSDVPETEKNPLDGNQSASTEAPGNDETTVAEIDWDLWCMVQCDSGHGGSACYCDLIP